MKFISPDQIDKLPNDLVNPQLWTAIIPAAGRGSRLGYSKPKILYPIAGRPILDWLVDLLEPYCGQLIFILSPDGNQDVSPLLEKRLSGKYTVTIQSQPKGMADAIYQAVPQIATPHTLIIWGDQIAIRPRTIRRLTKIHQNSGKTKLTMPIVERENPYVHYQADPKGNFIGVLEKREGAKMPTVGQSDCGLFIFNTKDLQLMFKQEIEKGITLSPATREWNFLPLLPKFETGDQSVQALRLDSLEETIGVNDQADALILEKYLRSIG